MKSLLIVAIGCCMLLSCSNEKSEDKTQQIVAEMPPKVEIKVCLKDLLYLLDNVIEQAKLEEKITALDFHKKFNGVYISSEMLTAKKPKHWINVKQLGDYVNISFKTADRKSWDNIISELSLLSKSKPFDDKSSDISLKYSSNGYKAETYKPKDGVNVNLNNLYEIIVMRSSK